MSTYRRGFLSEYFEGVAVKRLSAVETTPSKSNQHEFNGTEPLRRLLGEADRRRIPARFIRIEDQGDATTADGTLTWYDSRRNQKHRSAEYRLYYLTNDVSQSLKEGDSLCLAMRRDGSAIVIVTPPGSTIQNQLLWMFGIDHPELDFVVREITGGQSAEVDFAVRYILDEIGIEIEEPEVDVFDKILKPFGMKFPPTKKFSEIARRSLRDIDPLDEPDLVLMAWIEREELLFRRLERKIVSERLRDGFLEKSEADVDGFLSFSLSVQNRRKSRAGQSLENHLEALFAAHNIRFARGCETENRNRPDFLFPGQAEYRDKRFAAARLTMLGAKSTCKDRWRQVLSEAVRIKKKHLLTLEPGISENQTSEMRAKGLQLVLPSKLHSTYHANQRTWLMDVATFISVVRKRQASESG